MKTRHLLAIVLCTGILSFSCSGNKNTGNTSSDADSTAIDKNRTEIVLPDGIDSKENEMYIKDEADIKKYFADNHIDASARAELKIDGIKYNKLKTGDSGTEETNEYLHQRLAKASNDMIIKGKTLDQIEKGKLQVVYMLSDQGGNPAVGEFFVTYDKDGNYVDSKLVNYTVIPGWTEVSYNTKNNIVNVTYEQGGESWPEFYKVMPDLTITKVTYEGKALE